MVGHCEALYPNRIGYWHKRMGPPASFPCCGGTGVTMVCADEHDCEENEGRDCDVAEVYCDCAAGKKRIELEQE